jgi:4-amino-4-deoxy-L-arabinose transferase-like glycosyltransferase
MENKTNNKRITAGLILAAIILFGIILRTYHFHDWLRFNPDQSRDAELVSSVVNGEQPLPLLGPKAGGTEFRLGPAFYYFQYLAAKIFGDYPDKMAYPDLFFSILSIPLLFFLSKKYFNSKIALALAAVYAFSFYAIRYSRFAWNPNSAPFWTMLFLYALLEIFDSSEGPLDRFDKLAASKIRIKKIMWSVLAGAAVGIGIQLHTFLFVILPLLTIICFAYFAVKNKKILKYFVVVFLVAVILNIPQLLNEVRTGGANMDAFVHGASKKQEKEPLYSRVVRAGACFAVINTYAISSVGGSSSCELYSAKNKFGAAFAILVSLFFLGGMGLAVRGLKRQDSGKRRFLGLFLAYTGLSFLIIIPVAFEVSMRYFLTLIFMPFIFLGLWLDFLGEKLRADKIILPFIAVFLISLNFNSVRKDFTALANPASVSFVDIAYLGEVEEISNYMVTNADEKNSVFFDGSNTHIYKSANAILYVTDKKGIETAKVDKKDVPSGQIFFYLNSAKMKKSDSDKLREDYDILDSKNFPRYSVLKLRKK